jgi:hypothetical protein
MLVICSHIHCYLFAYPRFCTCDSYYSLVFIHKYERRAILDLLQTGLFVLNSNTTHILMHIIAQLENI